MPNSSFSNVVVVGCGISGLSAALRLLEAGHAVSIVAKELPPGTTSTVAAAIWYPFRAEPKDKVLKWSRETLEEFYRQAEAGIPGVKITEYHEYFDRPTEDPWWLPAVLKHYRITDLPPGYVDGIASEVPLSDTSVYVPYLMDRIRALGGTIEQREIRSLDELYAPNRLIVNCTGLGARELVNDPEMIGIRGQVVVVDRPPGLDVSITDKSGPLEITYIIVREKDCVLGGIAVETEELGADVDPNVAAEILRKSGELYPPLKNATVLQHKAGLRPGRTAVRLEAENVAGIENCRVIHNYGHGGAGYTLCWGCAAEVVDLAK